MVPFYGWGSTTSRLQSYYEEITLVLIAGGSIQVKPGFYFDLAVFFKMQLTWIKPASRLTLPNLAGSFKKSKKPGFSWVSWVCCQGNKTQPAELVTIWVLEPSYPTGYLGSGTQITMLLHFRTPYCY